MITRTISLILAVAGIAAGCGGQSASLADVATAAHAKQVTTPAALVQATVDQKSACADTKQLSKSGDASKKGRFVCVLWPGDRIVYGDTPSDFTG